MNIIPTIDDYINQFNYEDAISLLNQALEKEPYNSEYLTKIYPLYLEIGQSEKAQITLSTIFNFTKNPHYSCFLDMAQLLSGNESVDYYQKGINNLLELIQTNISATINPFDTLSTNEMSQLSQDLSSAYCAVAELYMTDLCDMESADTLCLEYLFKSLEINPSNIDSLQKLSQYYLLYEEKDKSTQTIQKCLNILNQQSDITLIPFDVRLNISRILIELFLFDSAVIILEDLLLEDDSHIESWILASVCYMNLGQTDLCQQYLSNLQNKDDLDIQTKELVENMIKNIQDPNIEKKEECLCDEI